MTADWSVAIGGLAQPWTPLATSWSPLPLVALLPKYLAATRPDRTVSQSVQGDRVVRQHNETAQ